MAVLAGQRQKAKGWPLTQTQQQQREGPSQAGPWAGRPRVLSAAGFSDSQPISLMRRQERGLCLKFMYKSQSAVFKENHRPHALGRAEDISGTQ